MPTPHLDKTLVTFTQPWSREAEHYQGLRWTIERLQRTRHIRVVAVTSPFVDDGKTVTAINVAGALTSRTTRVLLVDADLRKPTVSKLLRVGASGQPGLGELIADERLSFEQAVRPARDLSHVAVLSAGTRALPVPELLRSPRVEYVFEEARRRFDYTVVDTPPLVLVHDAAVLSRFVDGIVMVVAAHRTSRRHLEQALNLLEGSRVLGIVFNGARVSRQDYRDEYYAR